MSKFKVGDTVKVINGGSFYSNYDTMAESMSLKNWMFGDYPNKTIGKIVALKNHLKEDNKLLVGIRINGHDYIYEARGIKMFEHKFDEGDKILCTNPKGKNLTLGMEYEVSANQANLKIDVIDDRGVKCLHHQDRFNIYSSKKELIENNMEETTFEDVKNMAKSVRNAANKEILEEMAEEQKIKAKAILKNMYEERAELEKTKEATDDKLTELNEDLKNIGA